MPDGFDQVSGRWSHTAPVAYAEAECFGGRGEQRAVVRDGGAVVPTLSEGIDVVVEGRAERVTDGDELNRLAAAWETQGPERASRSGP
ncbi:hypothetical protein OG609_29450 [Streptomyces sp. NBC_01224]|uniref:hypothetical protein n=1 Tax=Streptomyces sp. NBC_01224 TaxID=2903783 RepID=UPI002E0D65B0|nr:hypothetical protein OG609_29450 [Streptomyces sp. NBC_01224]